MRKGILVATVGKTDPIRGEYDGPILHIVRWYRPRKVYLVLTKEIANDELEYHHNEEAIHLLDSECEVEIIPTEILDPHSYDGFSVSLNQICRQIKESHPEETIYLNISSGTPQMETALCMIAISDPERYCAIQVATPAKQANKAPMFDPRKDLVEEWFNTDMDNLEDSPSRCHEPQLLNFRKPIIQMQILSLIENYDYAGAYQLYERTKENFSETVGLLLDHARNRVNLKYKEAVTLAEKLQMKDALYPVKRSDISSLAEFFNSMKIKQIRGELNDFSMRLEVMVEYLGIYILENEMKIRLESITKTRNVNNSCIMRLDKEKCMEKIPGVDAYLDDQFFYSGFEWNKPLNGLSVVYIISYLSTKEPYQKYAACTAEMQKWMEVNAGVRNPAAHSIIAITDDMIRDIYGKDSEALCKAIQRVLIQVFGPQAKKEVFEIYQSVNRLIKNEMEK